MKYKLSDLLETLTDYHANGSYQILKKNVFLKDQEDYALMVRTTNLENNDFSQSLKFINKDAYEFLKKSKVFPGDILMNKIANPGSVYLMPNLDRPVSLAMNLFLLRIYKQKANPVYVYIYLKLNERYIKSFAQGSVTQTITKKAVSNLIVELPKRELQDQIVQIYESFTNKIEINKKTNETLEGISKALFKSWFINFDPVRAKAEGRSTGLPSEISDLFPDSFEDSELGQIPNGFTISSLAEVSKKVDYGYTASATNENTGSKFLRITDIQDGVVDWSTVPFCEISIENITKYTLSKGDIVIARTGNSTGENFLFQEDSQTVFASYLIRFRPDIKKISPSYLWRWMRTIYWSNFIEGAKTGSAQAGANAKVLGQFKFICPSMKLLEVIDTILSYLIKRQRSLQNENRTLISLRDTLLPKLFSGELRIPDAEKIIEEVGVQ